MSFLSHNTDMDAGAPQQGLPQLLDVLVGFFVWAAHFLVVYIATALACALGPGAANAGSRTALVTALALVTVTAAAIVVMHALRRYRQQREMPEQRFRMSVTIGCDALALVAIVWQLFPILLVPPCA